MPRRTSLHRAQIARATATAVGIGGPALLAALALVIGLMFTQAAWSTCLSYSAASQAVNVCHSRTNPFDTRRRLAKAGGMATGVPGNGS